MVDERHDGQPRQASALEGSGMEPPGSMQQRAGEMRSAAEQARDAMSSTAEQAREAAGNAADQAGERAYSMAESGREGAASGLENAAHRIEERMGGSEGMPAMAAERAAEGMQSAATYLREHETAEMWRDVEQYVQAHPMRSLAGAIAAGFVVGRILK